MFDSLQCSYVEPAILKPTSVEKLKRSVVYQGNLGSPLLELQVVFMKKLFVCFLGKVFGDSWVLFLILFLSSKLQS